MNNSLKIENLKYKDILNDLSFTLEDKTFNILCGPNSCGKSLLVKCILGLTKYEGSVYVFGELFTKENEENLRKKIGALTDFSQLLNGTVLYNIEYPLKNLDYSEDKAREKAYSICKKLDIHDIVFKNVDELSISEKKLVLFASAVVSEPSILMIDDSFDDLDCYNRKKIMNYLSSKTKSTILFITNRAEDYLYADNILIMNNGKIIINEIAKEALKNDKYFVKNNLELPFLVDLSNKLKSYGLIDDIILDVEKMVNSIWK